ncbi:MAG: ABC-F family ATP-binding cassette domain-containing protein, partial [Maricaulaceae bacterium]
RAMLHVNDLTYRIEGRTLFDQATVAIPQSAKIGLVGRNGTGKSTLFRLIKGEISPESGSVSLRKGVKWGAVAQEAPGGPQTILSVMLAADTERSRLLAEAETTADPHRIADIQTRLADIEAHSAEARAGEILHGLGFAHADQARPCSDFSGGWRMRVALAATLFARPDLLLLDEPTNYLDLEGAVWLEQHVRRYPGTVVLISHDRDLLNAACDTIVHLRAGKLNAFSGGYDDFQRQLAEKQRLAIALKDKQEAERRRLEAFVERFRAKASKATQAQSRVKRLEKMQPIATMIDEPVTPFHFPLPSKPPAPPIMALDGVAAGYDPDTPILKRLDLRIDPDDRIGLLGRNGAGKSTFAKLLTGALAPLDGKLKRHHKLQVAYFHQHQIDALNPTHSAYDHVRARMPEATEAQRRAKLAQFGLGANKAETPAGDLSGGEKARLLMGLVAFEGAHLLVLDEPTNHLDIDSRAALIDAINAFDGAVLLISHDRHLVESCADRLWIAHNATVEPYPADMEAYRADLLRREREGERKTTDAGGGTKAESRRLAAARRAELAPLKAEIESWEAEMERLTGLIEKFDQALADPNMHASAPDKIAELSVARARLADKLEAAETSWLEAGEALEAARAD